MDTIFALATGQSVAAIAIIRLSGPDTDKIITGLTGQDLPTARQLVRRKLYKAGQDLPVDEAMLAWFPAPKSYSGEDMAELHIHGGPATRQAVFAALMEDYKARPAEAGEFSRRAFWNGKLDLTALEGLNDLVTASTEAQRRQAFNQMDGKLSDIATSWRHKLIDLSARAEAMIDFAEDEVPAGQIDYIAAAAKDLLAELTAHIDNSQRAQKLSNGLKLAIIGPPNAGKSSLLNFLVGDNRAIVTPTPGTTRDIVDATISIADVPVTICDTAGIRAAEEAIEKLGIEKSKQAAAQADLIIFLTAFDDPQAALTIQADLPADSDCLYVQNKSDLAAGAKLADDDNIISISLKTGDNCNSFIQRLHDKVHKLARPETDINFTRARQLDCLLKLKQALLPLAGGESINSDTPAFEGEAALIGENLRAALHQIARLTGTIDVEDVLDHLFTQFCIGK